MNISIWDILIIVLFLSITLFVGLYASRTSGKNSTEYFLSGRTMPWWLLGVSMVATTFSTDTPNLVTDIVRKNGVAGNWVWWAFLITGLLTVFVYARLWRKSGVSTDLEFYELRYGGKAAQFLRGFRSVYLGVIFNIITMTGVTLAAIKIAGVMLGIEPWETILVGGIITVIFSAVGGFKGVVYTDFILFFVAMAGSIGAAYYLVNLPEIGGVSEMITHPLVQDKIDLLPDFSDTKTLITLLIIPLAVQWWSSWYPGSEPGGGGYIAQRMLATKNEDHSISATFFFNIMHYALRPWPWIIIALSSLIIFPDMDTLKEVFPSIQEGKIGNDLAYSAMLTKLPTGLLGLVLASLVAAYMSTISTQLNWGASYIAYDFYAQIINPKATERQLVNVGKLSTIFLMVVSSILALYVQNALQLFELIIVFGAGTGLIFILRWFWWRINAWSEITAMFVSGIVSIIFKLTPLGPVFFDTEKGLLPDWMEYPMIVLITTTTWLLVTYLTPPERKEILFNFYKKIRPSGVGWNKVVNDYRKENESKDATVDALPPKKKGEISSAILAVIFGCILIYSLLFATGYLIYGKNMLAIINLILSSISTFFLIKQWKKIKLIIKS